MGTLFELATRVTRALESAHEGDAIGLIRAKGELASKTGFLVAMIGRTDPDDPEKIFRLRQAATELGIPLQEVS